MGVKLLSKLGTGEKGRVVKIRGKAGMHRLLFDLGLFVGRTVAIEKTCVTHHGEPIEVRVKTDIFSLETKVADNIQVEVA